MSRARRLFGLLWRLCGCRHDTTYRERRSVGRVAGVLHWVCVDCGHAAPVLDRSPSEHAKVIRDGRVKRLRVTRHGAAKVESIRRKVGR